MSGTNNGPLILRCRSTSSRARVLVSPYDCIALLWCLWSNVGTLKSGNTQKAETCSSSVAALASSGRAPLCSLLSNRRGIIKPGRMAKHEKGLEDYCCRCHKPLPVSVIHRSRQGCHSSMVIGLAWFYLVAQINNLNLKRTLSLIYNRKYSIYLEASR
jgi:hypothetical protein